VKSDTHETFSWPTRVYYEDTDSGGVVYYANYLKFMERARTEWLRARGFEQSALAREHGIVFVVHDVHIRYLRPALFDDALLVTVKIQATGRSWIEFVQTAERGNEILTRAQVKIVCVNHLSFKPVEVPELIRDHMEIR
jgi:acyl-CoA thioester hydrolase